MKKKRNVFFLCFLILMMCPLFVFAKNDVVINSVENLYENESGIVFNQGENKNVVFNDIGQQFKYKIVLENTSKKSVYVQNIELSKPSEEFMDYSVSGISVSEELKAGEKKEVYVTLESLADKGYGYNFNDLLELEVIFNDVSNPGTVDLILIIVLLFVVSGVAFVFVSRKKASLLVLLVMFSGVLYVKADDVIKVNFDSFVSFKSQNVLEPTGIYYVQKDNEVSEDGSIVTYTDKSRDISLAKVVDVWKYSSSIKQIFIENEIREIKDYAYKFDISEEKNGKVFAYLVENKEDSSLYDCYVMANGLVYANENSQGLFANMSLIQKINNLSGIDFSETTNMAMLFYGCTNLVELDLSTFDTSNVDDMSRMFQLDKSLKKLDVSSFDTSSVTDMYRMFASTSSITKLDVSTFDTSNVENFYMTFGSMTSLTELELGDFKTDNATSTSAMFYNLPNLTELDVSSFNTSKVKDMSLMFAGHPTGDQAYSGLTKIVGLNNFDTSNVTDMNAMFQLDTEIPELDLTSFNTKKVTNMRAMFNSCYSFNKLDLSSFDFSSVKDMTAMFYYVGWDNRFNGVYFDIDISGFDFVNISDDVIDDYLFDERASYDRWAPIVLVKNFDSKNWVYFGNGYRVASNKVLIKNSTSEGDAGAGNYDVSGVTQIVDGKYYSAIGD